MIKLPFKWQGSKTERGMAGLESALWAWRLGFVFCFVLFLNAVPFEAHFCTKAYTTTEFLRLGGAPSR